MRIVDSSKAASGLTLVLVALGANLALFLLETALGRVLPDLWNSPVVLALQLCWLGAAAVLAAGLVQVAMAVDVPAFVWATVAAIAINAIADLGFTVLTRHAADMAFTTAVMHGALVLGLVERWLLVFVLASLAAPRHAWVWAVAGLVLLLSLVRAVMRVVVSLGFVSPTALYGSGGYPVLVTFMGLVSSVSMVAIAWAALKTARDSVSGVIPLIPPTEHGLRGPPVVDAPASPVADFAIGGVVLLVGIGVTVVSAQAASNGGRYVVATGAIAVGVVRIIRGFVRLARR